MGATAEAAYCEELAAVLNYIRYGHTQLSIPDRSAKKMLSGWFAVYINDGNQRVMGRLIVLGAPGESPDMCAALEINQYGSGMKYLCFRVPYTRKSFDYHFANKLKDNFYYL